MPQWLKDLGNWFKDIVTSHPYGSIVFLVLLAIIVLSLIFTDGLQPIVDAFAYPW